MPEMTYGELGHVIMTSHRNNLALEAHFVTRTYTVDGVPMLVVIASGHGAAAVAEILTHHSRPDPRHDADESDTL